MKSNPRAALVAEYTPKLRRNPLTRAMMIKAGIAKRFNLKGGTLYTVPRVRPRVYSFVMAGPKFRALIIMPAAARPTTKIQAKAGDSSPV